MVWGYLLGASVEVLLQHLTRVRKLFSDFQVCHDKLCPEGVSISMLGNTLMKEMSIKYLYYFSELNDKIGFDKL